MDCYPVVYLIICLVNGKRYVGSTHSFYKRFNGYKQAAKQPVTPIERAMHKHGFSNFNFTILERLETFDKVALLAREQFWLDKIHSFVRTKTGYNICEQAGSCQGVTHSPESRHHMSQGRRKQAAIKSRRVLQIDAQTLQIKAEHVSCGMAAECIGISEQSIREVCQGGCRMAGGFTWCYKDQYCPSSFRLREKKRRGGPANGRLAKPVIQMDMEGNKIRIWDHVKVAATALGVGMPGLYDACSGRASCAFGFKWAYSNDPALIDSVNNRRKEAWCLANNL